MQSVSAQVHVGKDHDTTNVVGSTAVVLPGSVRHFRIRSYPGLCDHFFTIETLALEDPWIVTWGITVSARGTGDQGERSSQSLRLWPVH